MHSKSLFRVFSGFLVLLVSMPVLAADREHPFFVTASLGESRTEFRPGVNDVVSDKDGSFEIGVGYSFTPFLSIQGSYHDFGEPIGYAGCPPEVLCIQQFAPSDVDMDGWSVALTGSVPLGERFDLFGKLGLMSWDASSRSPTLNDSGEDALFAAGGTWNVSSRWGVQLSYEWVDLDIKSTKLGAVLRF